jgi:uncharacterized phage protein gp47/JayE
MAIYARKRRAEILREALWRLEKDTPITSTSPGSVARAFTEAISEQLGDMYDALEYNLAQSVISTATGRSLDLLGELYGIRRRTLSDMAAVNAQLGAFYFYIDTPYGSDIVIPSGTRVYTGIDSFIGRQLAFDTTAEAIIQAGRTKVFASIRPSFSDGMFSAAANTLTTHNFTSPPGTTVNCTNPKAIAPQPGYESDQNFRVRLVKAIRVASSGTSDAVRFAALNVNGVRDVKIRQAPYGMGTFEALVIAENPTSSVGVYASAKVAMDQVRPVGVRMIVKEPSTILVDISVSIVLGSSVVEDNLADMVRVSVMRYINSLLPGDTLVYNRLIQAIMDTSSAIQDVRINRFAPRGVETIRRNYVVKDDEQVIPGSITIQIAS